MVLVVVVVLVDVVVVVVVELVVDVVVVLDVVVGATVVVVVGVVDEVVDVLLVVAGAALVDVVVEMPVLSRSDAHPTRATASTDTAAARATAPLSPRTRTPNTPAVWHSSDASHPQRAAFTTTALASPHGRRHC